MRDDTPFIDVRIGIKTSYDKLCQCSIVPVNLVCGSQVCFINYLFGHHCSKSRCPGLCNPNQQAMDFGGFYAVFMLSI